MSKLKKLKEILDSMGSVLVAYSGGVDSTFLLKIVHDTLKDKVLAVTATSATYPPDELVFSKKIARELGVRHKIIKTFELNNKQFVLNPVKRCYFCKKELFSKLKKIAKRNKLNFVVDASNLSDKDDFRPGEEAARELNIRSPLKEAGFSKDDIRKLSKEFGLSTWDKPSLACLASRIPYGRKISTAILSRIREAEKVLRGLRFSQVRVRDYNNLCRIEVLRKDIPRLINKRNWIVDNLKQLGYDYVTVDLEGYRTGSMNPAN